MTAYASYLGEWSINYGRGKTYHHHCTAWSITKTGRYTWTLMNPKLHFCKGGFRSRKAAYEYWSQMCYPFLVELNPKGECYGN